ncbi:MAG: hypothetical protein IKC72_06775 [Clostridia bacterium]|nr:hypothetical protein [Clostridia bacterium]
MHYCSVCKKDFDSETPSVLTMGRSMTPRYICPECESLMDEAIGATDPIVARSAIARLGDLLASSDIDDGPVIHAVTSHLDQAKERAQQIEDGTYDFSLDEEEGEEFELTEDMLETEEDRELDRREEEQEKRLNTFLNWAWLGIGIGVVGYVIYLIISRFF